VFQKHLKMSFSSSSRVYLDKDSSVHLSRHNSNDFHHNIHRDFHSLGKI